MAGYAPHARSGLDAKLPRIGAWENQFPGYTVTIVDPEYNAICPKTGLPDFGTVTVEYEPDRWCIELKSFKGYMTAYRNVGIFYENAVNRILRDLVRACRPKRMKVTGQFNARGGIGTRVEARYERPTGNV
ncbi:MAG: NADPH-dependent 7-cyano-7-deazaguanine reductase QueF [Planctomycetes bacterium]|nr:NADPH-dependent 7-cyano-7-deazaguanine reductase QueF [Planctomycetota bacterium]